MFENTRTDYLPQEFLTRMERMLGAEFPAFTESYQKPRTYGLRINTQKISCEEFEKIVPFDVRPIPWIKGGYFYGENIRPSHCPLYQAGIYYLQEPSAMTPASLLAVNPGEYVLDLCAAPGGKATALGAKLKGQGLLIANDISNSRAKALLRNIELFGITNAFVTNEPSERMAAAFPGFFHKILLDAPCSGEGMFRKEEALARDWTPQKSEELSKTQQELILRCADMLRPGGMLLYSTCTFAPAEDEGTVSFLLENREDMELIDLPKFDGFSDGNPAWGNGDNVLTKCVRLFPHKMNGEGHFMALLKKKGESLTAPFSPTPKQNTETRKWLGQFLEEIGLTSLGGKPFDWKRVETRGDKVYYLPPVRTDFRGLNFLRNGLYLGDLKKNRFEPSQPFALAIDKNEARAVISLTSDDERLNRYLKGEPISISGEEAYNTRGWHLLCTEGYPLAFGKLVNGTLKNKYPAGWRIV